MEIKNELSEYFFQNPFIGITVCDREGICIEVNDAQTRIVGIPRDEFIGNTMENIVSKHMLSSSATVKVLEKKTEVNIMQASRNGNTYEVKAFPIFDEDRNIKYVINYLLDNIALSNYEKDVQRLENNMLKKEELIKILSSADSEGNFVYTSKTMKEKFELVKKIAPTDATVLITGSSGVGKELIADIIQENSRRKDKPFIKLNCAAFPEHLLESELFGYEPGAFTGGKTEGNAGLFEAADGGTLLFDEIGEMPLNLQAKILRVLQDQKVRRIGADSSVKVDVRILASTNASLKDLIKEKKFRKDLYYRLNVISVEIPDLDKRREDIPGLVAHFLVFFNKKYSLHKTLDTGVINYLQSLEYPGNVRELHNLMERIILQSNSDFITTGDVYAISSNYDSESASSKIGELPIQIDDIPLKQAMENFEYRLLEKYIEKYGKTVIISEKLGIDRSTLTRKMKKLGLSQD